MIERPRTIEEARKYRYRMWAGNPKGYRYNEGYCAEEVMDGGMSPLFHQCSRKAVAGPSNLYCRQHAKRFAEDKP